MSESFDRNVLTESFEQVSFLEPHFEFGPGAGGGKGAQGGGGLAALQSGWPACLGRRSGARVGELPGRGAGTEASLVAWAQTARVGRAVEKRWSLSLTRGRNRGGGAGMWGRRAGASVQGVQCKQGQAISI